MTSYEPKHYAEDGRLYVVVTLDDGSTFGQYIEPGTVEEMDQQVAQAVRRVDAQTPEEVSAVQFGAARTVEL